VTAVPVIALTIGALLLTLGLRSSSRKPTARRRSLDGDGGWSASESDDSDCGGDGDGD